MVPVVTPAPPTWKLDFPQLRPMQVQLLVFAGCSEGSVVRCWPPCRVRSVGPTIPDLGRSADLQLSCACTLALDALRGYVAVRTEHSVDERGPDLPVSLMCREYPCMHLGIQVY